MKKINFIDKHDYVLFLPNIYFKIFLSYKNFNISRKGFLGVVLKNIYRTRFSNSYSVYFEYLKYYRKEFNTYKEFLDCHYNLVEFELNNLLSIFLRCSRTGKFSSHNNLLYVKTIREKLNNYFGGKFYIYEN